MIGIAVILISILTASKDLGAFFIGIAVLFSWLFLRQKSDRRDFNMLIWSLLISTPLVIFIYTFSLRYDFIINLYQYRIITHLNISLHEGFVVLSWALLSLGCYSLQQKYIDSVPKPEVKQLDKYKNAIVISGIPLLFTGIAQSFALEFLNVMNKNIGVLFSRPLLMYISLMFFAVVTSVCIFLYYKNRNNGCCLDMRNLIFKLYVPITLVTFVFMIIQPYRMTSAGNEFFEMANHGLAVDQFFRECKLFCVNGNST